MLTNDPPTDDSAEPLPMAGQVPAGILEARERLKRLGLDPQVLVACVEEIDYLPETQQRLRSLSAQAGIELEQLALYETAKRYVSAVSALPVADSVRTLLEREFALILRGEETPTARVELGSPGFAATCRIVTLRRMPAGPMDWDISGFPRSWLLKIPRRQLPSALSFLLTRMRGFRPYFHMHVARKPRNRALVIEREVLRAYWRIGTSMAMQPGIRGLMASAWFHDLSAIASYPHLEWLNRPYLQEGGFITDIGEAPLDSGFADNNAKRRELAEHGALRFRLGVALWPREPLIAWAERHPEFAG